MTVKSRRYFPPLIVLSTGPLITAVIFKFRRVLCALLLVMMASPIAGNAQSLVTPDANLAELNMVRVTASQTTPDAVPCGLDLRLLMPVVEKRLQGGGLATTKSPKAVITFSLMTTHNPAGRLCATAAMLGAYRLVNYFDDTAGWVKTGYAVLWQRGAQVLSSPSDHPLATERTLARLIDELLKTRRQQRLAASTAN